MLDLSEFFGSHIREAQSTFFSGKCVGEFHHWPMFVGDPVPNTVWDNLTCLCGKEKLLRVECGCGNVHHHTV